MQYRKFALSFLVMAILGTSAFAQEEEQEQRDERCYTLILQKPGNTFQQLGLKRRAPNLLCFQVSEFRDSNPIIRAELVYQGMREPKFNPEAPVFAMWNGHIVIAELKLERLREVKARITLNQNVFVIREARVRGQVAPGLSGERIEFDGEFHPDTHTESGDLLIGDDRYIYTYVHERRCNPDSKYCDPEEDDDGGDGN